MTTGGLSDLAYGIAILGALSCLLFLVFGPDL